MTIIGLAANDQSLSIVSKPKVASGDQNSVKVQIDFDAVWDDYGKSAVFFTDKKPKDVYEIILVNGECVIPFEVLEKSGVLYIGVRGVNASEDKVKTSTLVKYKIVDGAPEGEGASVPPTANVYQQLMTAYGKTQTLLSKEAEERKVADSEEASERKAADSAEASERKAEIAVERARIDQLLTDGEVLKDGVLYVVSKSITATTSEKTLTIQLPESFRINPLVFVNVRPENNIDWYFGTSGTQTGGSGGSSSGSGASPDDETPTELKFTYVSKVGASVPGWVQFIIAKTESAFLGGKDDELADMRVGADGIVYDSAGTAIRNQVTTVKENIKAMTYCVEELYLKGCFEPELSFENKYFNSASGKLVDNETRAITNPIYCPYGSDVEIKCNDGYSVTSTGNYDAFGNYLGYGNDFAGMTFRRYVIGKANSSEAITPEEAFENTVVTISVPRMVNRYSENATLRNYAEATIGKNLFNREYSEKGFIVDEHGKILDLKDGIYSTSEFIPISEGESITISPRLRKFLVYDEFFQPVSGSFLDAETTNHTYTASHKGFIRFTYYNSDKYVQAEHGTVATGYEKFFKVLEENVFIAQDASKLNGKKGVSFGDSIMHGSGNDNEGILDILAERYGISVQDYSVGGASMQAHQDRQFIGNQIDAALSDGISPDFILIDGLSNDIERSALGEISIDFKNHNASTFASGLEYCFERLKMHFPSVPVLYIIPHSSAARNYETEKTFGNLAREICAKWSIPIADIYREGNMNARIEQQMQKFTFYPEESSGTHPNRNGYEFAYIPIIKNALEKMIK